MSYEPMAVKTISGGFEVFFGRGFEGSLSLLSKTNLYQYSSINFKFIHREGFVVYLSWVNIT